MFIKKLATSVIIALTVIVSAACLFACPSALAENIDGVLRDCKLDRNRWQIVEWSKPGKFVRFYDSESVSVTGPSLFQIVTYDYFYGGICNEENCGLRNTKHYHSEKSIYDSFKVAKKLLAFGRLDANLNIVDSYEYPASMQVYDSIKKKSVDEKTVFKGKELFKNDKAFAEEQKPIVAKESNYGKFAPLPQPIGSSDGEWVYLGRFIGPNNLSYVENILLMKPFNGTTAQDGVMDIYYHHVHHEMCVYHEYGYGYGCVLNGNKLQRRGINTELVTIGGGTKGAFGCAVREVRKFDTATHELVETMTDKKVDIYWTNAKLNRRTKSGELMDTLLHEYGNDNPFSLAMRSSNCPKPDYWK
jgi:hypothetical protein